MASPTSQRGAGLGNEVVAWAKSYIAASVLGQELAAPAWLLNRYRLGPAFGISRYRMAHAEAVRRSPRAQVVTRDLFNSTGSPDYGEALRRLVARGDLDPHRSTVHKGLWGGYRSIVGARGFLRGQLLGQPTSARLVDHVLGPLDPTCLRIGVHIRRGDFLADPPGPGDFNKAIPLEWYAQLIETLDAALDGACHFIVCSDADDLELAGLGTTSRLTLARAEGVSAMVAELSLLSQTDLLLCSVSSFSMLAAFLSEGPYVWYRPQLSPVGSRLVIWPDDSPEPQVADPQQPRGFPWDVDQTLPENWLRLVAAAANLRAVDRDLILYGSVGRDPGDQARA